MLGDLEDKNRKLVRQTHCAFANKISKNINKDTYLNKEESEESEHRRKGNDYHSNISHGIYKELIKIRKNNDINLAGEMG